MRKLRFTSVAWSHFTRVITEWIIFGISVGLTQWNVEAVPPPAGEYFPVYGEVNPVGGSVLFSTNADFSNEYIQGRVVSTVISGDLSNAWGGLTFSYQVFITNGYSTSFYLNGFGDISVGASYQVPAVGVIPANTYKTFLGGVWAYFFSLTNAVTAGKYSALLVMQTDATHWNLNNGLVRGSYPIDVPIVAPNNKSSSNGERGNKFHHAGHVSGADSYRK